MRAPGAQSSCLTGMQSCAPFCTLFSLQRTSLPPQLVLPPNSKNVVREQYKHLVKLFFVFPHTRTFFEPDFAAREAVGVFYSEYHPLSFVAPFSLAAPRCRKFVPTLRPSDGESYYVSHPFSFVSHFLSIHMLKYV